LCGHVFSLVAAPSRSAASGLTRHWSEPTRRSDKKGDSQSEKNPPFVHILLVVFAGG
jgi:hypothetical protein